MNTEPQTPEERIAELEEKLAESQRELASVRESQSFQFVMVVFLIIGLMIGPSGSEAGEGFWGQHKWLVVLLLALAVAIVWNIRLFLRALKDPQS